LPLGIETFGIEMPFLFLPRPGNEAFLPLRASATPPAARPARATPPATAAPLAAPSAFCAPFEPLPAAAGRLPFDFEDGLAFEVDLGFAFEAALGFFDLDLELAFAPFPFDRVLLPLLVVVAIFLLLG
jgi:hypothetical protein